MKTATISVWILPKCLKRKHVLLCSVGTCFIRLIAQAQDRDDQNLDGDHNLIEIDPLRLPHRTTPLQKPVDAPGTFGQLSSKHLIQQAYRQQEQEFLLQQAGGGFCGQVMQLQPTWKLGSQNSLEACLKKWNQTDSMRFTYRKDTGTHSTQTSSRFNNPLTFKSLVNGGTQRMVNRSVIDSFQNRKTLQNLLEGRVEQDFNLIPKSKWEPSAPSYYVKTIVYNEKSLSKKSMVASADDNSFMDSAHLRDIGTPRPKTKKILVESSVPAGLDDSPRQPPPDSLSRSYWTRQFGMKETPFSKGSVLITRQPTLNGLLLNAQFMESNGIFSVLLSDAHKPDSKNLKFKAMMPYFHHALSYEFKLDNTDPIYRYDFNNHSTRIYGLSFEPTHQRIALNSTMRF